MLLHSICYNILGYFSEECYIKCNTKLYSNKYALHSLLSLVYITLNEQGVNSCEYGLLSLVWSGLLKAICLSCRN